MHNIDNLFSVFELFVPLLLTEHNILHVHMFKGEVTAEELRQRLNGAKERVSSQPPTEQRLQTADSGEQQSSSVEAEERGAGREEVGLIYDFFRSIVR